MARLKADEVLVPCDDGRLRVSQVVTTNVIFHKDTGHYWGYREGDELPDGFTLVTAQVITPWK